MRAQLLSLLALGGGPIGCQTDPAPASCVPNQTSPCTCTNGNDGTQVCLSDLTYSVCQCSSSPDAGNGMGRVIFSTFDSGFGSIHISLDGMPFGTLPPLTSATVLSAIPVLSQEMPVGSHTYSATSDTGDTWHGTFQSPTPNMDPQDSPDVNYGLYLGRWNHDPVPSGSNYFIFYVPTTSAKMSRVAFPVDGTVLG